MLRAIPETVTPACGFRKTSALRTPVEVDELRVRRASMLPDVLGAVDDE
jgi:hypothetical protein